MHPSNHNHQSSPRQHLAVSLIELIVAISLFSIIFYGGYQLLSQATRQERSIFSGLSAEQLLRTRVSRIIRDVQEGLEIFRPMTAGKTVDGLGIVDAGGNAIFYYAAPRAGGAEVTPLVDGLRKNAIALYRENLNTKEKICLIDRLNDFRVTLMPTVAGKAATCITLHVSVLAKTDDNTERDLHGMITRVFLRNAEKNFPEEAPGAGNEPYRKKEE